jgi:hypothetical protein
MTELLFLGIIEEFGGKGMAAKRGAGQPSYLFSRDESIFPNVTSFLQ